jgi:hypothetical protein
MRSVVVGDVVEQGVLFEQGSTLLETMATTALLTSTDLFTGVQASIRPFNFNARTP